MASEKWSEITSFVHNRINCPHTSPSQLHTWPPALLPWHSIMRLLEATFGTVPVKALSHQSWTFYIFFLWSCIAAFSINRSILCSSWTSSGSWFRSSILGWSSSITPLSTGNRAAADTVMGTVRVAGLSSETASPILVITAFWMQKDLKKKSILNKNSFV